MRPHFVYIMETQKAKTSELRLISVARNQCENDLLPLSSVLLRHHAFILYRTSYFHISQVFSLVFSNQCLFNITTDNVILKLSEE